MMRKRLLRGFRAMIATAFLLLSSSLLPVASVYAAEGGGNEDCPVGTVQLAKYNFVGNSYVAESGGSDVSVTGTAESGTFTVLKADTTVSAVVVKGSTDAKITTYANVTTGTFDNSGLINNGGQTPAISNVKICGPVSTEVTPAAATFSDLCETALDTYTIPTTTGVTYNVDAAIKAAGTYAGTGTVTVTATANTGYTLTGTSTWSHTYTDVPCVLGATIVTPAPATFSDVCGTEDDTYTIPTTTGVIYSVNGDTKAAGTYAGTGTVTVIATADVDYELTGATSWEHTFTDEECPAPETVVICHATDSVTNTYEKIEVAASAADGDTGNDNGESDHSTHTGPIATTGNEAQALKDANTAWGDIIPPHHNYAGLNWTTEGQAFYEADCISTDAPTDVCPNIDGVQTSVPAGQAIDQNGNCVTPGRGGDVLGDSTTITPVLTILTAATKVTPTGGQGAVLGATLANTGSSALLNIFAGLFVLGITGAVTIMSRKGRMTTAAQSLFKTSAPL